MAGKQGSPGHSASHPRRIESYGGSGCLPPCFNLDKDAEDPSRHNAESQHSYDLMKIGCIIVTYNGEKWIEPCLRSIFEAKPPHPSVWVVDNASPDRTVQVVRQGYPQVRVICNEGNCGFARGVNCGIRAALQAGMDCLVLLNQDMVIETGWLEELEKVAREKPSGIWGALELTYDGQGMDPANRLNLFEQVPEILDDLLFGRLKDAYKSRVVFGGCVAIHRSVIERIGYFDELFFMYCEDIDFCQRATRAGIEIWFLPFFRVRHRCSLSSEGGYENPRIARLNRRGWMIISLKDPLRPFWRALAAELRIQARGVLRNVLWLRWEGISNCLSDGSWLLAHAGRIFSARTRDKRSASKLPV